MLERHDILVRDALGAARAWVEVKRVRGRDAAWAEAWVQRARAASPWGPPVAILLVTLDRAFLWSGFDQPRPTVVDVENELGPYFARTQIDPGSVGENAFVLLVRWWLEDLLAGPLEAVAASDTARLIRGSLERPGAPAGQVSVELEASA